MVVDVQPAAVRTVAVSVSGVVVPGVNVTVGVPAPPVIVPPVIAHV